MNDVKLWEAIRRLDDVMYFMDWGRYHDGGSLVYVGNELEEIIGVQWWMRKHGRAPR